MAPTMGLITTKQQAEIAAKAQMAKDGGVVSGSSTTRELGQSVTADVLNGMKALTDVLTIVGQASMQIRTDDTPTVDVTEPRDDVRS
jgi:hypothetical protein